MRRPWLLASLLALFVLTASAAEAIVLYWVEDRSLRLSLGLLLLALIYWASTRLALVERTRDLLTPPLHPRRFHRLRADVVRLLEEIRRLNALALDQGPGAGDVEETAREMDSIEVWLKDHVGRIRDSVGKADE